MTTLMRRLALWKAQRGAYLADLEQLQASISLPSTIKMVWSLRAFTFTSVALVVIWSFYYLGSQASKLEYRFVESRPFKTLPAAYMDPNSPSFFSSSDTGTDSASIESLNVQLVAAMVYGQPVDQDTQDNQATRGYDASGNALVPVLENVIDPYFAAIAEEPGHGGWVDVSKASQNSYSSFSGTTLYIHAPGSDDGAYFPTYQLVGDFNYNTSYFLVNCEPAELLAFDAFPKGVLPNQSVSLNMTKREGQDEEAGLSSPHQLELWGRWTKDKLYLPWKTGSMRSFCNLTLSHVEVGVHCASTGCLARRMRFTEGQGSRSNVTQFDNDEFAAAFFSNFLLSTGMQTDIDEPTWMGSAIDLNAEEEGFFEPPQYGSEDRAYNIQVISSSLTQLINTYYEGSLVPAPDPAITTDNITSIVEQDTNPAYKHTILRGEVYDPQYFLDIPWIIVDLVSCKILFVAAVVCFWLRKQTLAPDIFGYVSTLTRDNPNLNLPDGGTTLSGLDRSRLLKNVKIRIADVHGLEGGVGRVGVHLVDDDSSHASYLTNDKRYL